MKRSSQSNKTMVRKLMAGLTCTALATLSGAPASAFPARKPAMSVEVGNPLLPLIVQVQRKGTGTTGGASGTTGGTSSAGSGAQTGGGVSQTGGGSGGTSAGGGGGTSAGSGNEPGTNVDPTRAGQSGGGRKSRIYYYINDNATDRIRDELSEAISACSPELLERRYRIDCLRLHFWRLSRDLPANGEYAPVRAALEKAAADLDAIVRQNLDTSAPRLRVREKGKPAAPLLPPIRAVRIGTEAKVARQAERVIAEATTALLRSTENSDRRMVHYQQIASAISSTKVLLRSA